jgi:queuosine biosynthesis protein QueD
MTETVSRIYHFEAAHRLEGHEKCGKLHGHSYKVEITLEGAVENGMVVDFHLMDKIINPILDEMDHHFIMSQETFTAIPVGVMEWFHEGGQAYNFPYPQSTAENIAVHIADELNLTLGAYPSLKASLRSVKVWETERSCAEWLAN